MGRVISWPLGDLVQKDRDEPLEEESAEYLKDSVIDFLDQLHDTRYNIERVIILAPYQDDVAWFGSFSELTVQTGEEEEYNFAATRELIKLLKSALSTCESELLYHEVHYPE